MRYFEVLGRGRFVEVGYLIDGEERTPCARFLSKHAHGGVLINLDEYDKAKAKGVRRLLLQNPTSGMSVDWSIEQADAVIKTKSPFEGKPGMGQAVAVDPSDVGVDYDSLGNVAFPEGR